MADALAREDRARGKRVLAKSTEREYLANGYWSSYGRPKLRTTLGIETRPS